jgi:hypothetical protein
MKKILLLGTATLITGCAGTSIPTPVEAVDYANAACTNHGGLVDVRFQLLINNKLWVEARCIDSTTISHGNIQYAGPPA